MRKRTTLRKSPRRFNLTKKKFGRTGYFKVIRWSNLDTTNNCHFQIAGNDVLSSGEAVTTFALNNVAGTGELQSLFDNYRIIKVLYRFLILRDPSGDGITTANRGVYPRLVWAHDFNDTVAVNRNQLMQRAGLREAYFGDNMQKTRWYSLKPAVQSRVYESAVFDSYSPKWRQWIDTSEAACPHYAIKYAWDQNFTGQLIRMEAKLVVECKGIS